MAAQPKLQLKKFDEAKLKSMVEPITVRIEKIRGAQRTPILLPPGEDPEAPQNGGLAMEDIRNLESFLSTQWSGGGFYEITATDSSQPVALTMTWQPYFDPALYPERKPPTPDEAAAGATPILQLPVQQRGNVTAFPNGFPQFQPQQPMGQYTPYPALPAAPPIGTNQWQMYQAEVDKRRHEEEVARLRDDAARREREAQEAKHRAELDREKQANAERQRALESQVSDLRNMFSGFVNEVKNLIGSNKTDPQVEAMKAQLAATEARAERERQEREAERRDQQTRDLIRQTNENMQRQIDMVMQKFDERTRQIAESNKAPDAMLMLFKENQREQAELVKEISRNAAQSIDKLQGQMMRPTEVLQMVQAANSAADANTGKLAGAYENVLNMHGKVLEQAIQLQPSGGGVVDVVRDGVNGLKEFAERYVGAKSAENRMIAQANVEMAQAQAHAMHVQAAVASGQPVTMPTVHTPPAPAAQSQLGAPAAKAPKFETPEEEPQYDTTKRHGKTDKQWFGVAVDEVYVMRENVDKFIDALKQNPENPPTQPNGKHFGMNPEEAAMGIIMATQMAAQNNLNIPAIIDLLMEKRYADFLDVLLPNAPQPYRDDVAQILVKKIAVLSGEAPPPDPVETDDDDDDNDDDDGDDAKHETKPVQNGRPVLVPTPSKPSKQGPARRA